MLSLVLVDLAALEDAERELDLLLDLLTRNNDRFHLASALINRARLWSARGLVERSAEDMRQVIQLSREGGQAQLERMATYNMAEDLMWQGALDEALRLARRSLALQLGQGEGSAAVDRVLVARVLAARHDQASLVEVLATIESDTSDELAREMGGAADAILEALRAAAGSRSWTAALTAADELPPQMQIEVALLAAADGQLPAERRAPIIELARADPNFVGRVREL